MKGKTQEEIFKEREHAKQAFQDLGWAFVETVQDTMPADKAYGA